MNDEDVRELWEVVEQIRHVLDGLHDSLCSLEKRDRSMSRMYNSHCKRYLGQLEGFIVAHQNRNRNKEEEK